MTTYSMSSTCGIVRYSYRDGEFGFATNLLSEVGAPYQQWFYDEIVRRGWIVERGVGIEDPPWCVDVLTREVGEGQGYVDTSY